MHGDKALGKGWQRLICAEEVGAAHRESQQQFRRIATALFIAVRKGNGGNSNDWSPGTGAARDGTRGPKEVLS